MCIRTCARETRRGQVQLGDEVLHAIVRHRRRIGIEGVGLDDVGAGVEKRVMNLADDGRTRQRQQVIVAFEVAVPLGEALAAVFVLPEAIALNHRAHGPVEQQDALPERRMECVDAFLAVHSACAPVCGRIPSAWQIANASSQRFSV